MILRSGKYKGQLISEVQQYDPGYIRWCKENTPWMLKQPKTKTNAAEQEFMSDWKEQSKLSALFKRQSCNIRGSFRRLDLATRDIFRIFTCSNESND